MENTKDSFLALSPVGQANRVSRRSVLRHGATALALAASGRHKRMVLEKP